MNFLGTIKLVVRTLLARKGRSFLTILGIMIGVAGVIIIIALGAGARTLVLGQITKLGSNLLSVQPGKSNEKGPPAQMFGIVVTTLRNQDTTALRNKERVPHATAISAFVRGGVSVTWRDKTIDTNFLSTDAEYPKVVNFSMSAGRFFDSRENQGSVNIVVLGQSVATELFGGTNTNPVGQVIKIRSSLNPQAGGIPLRIIGVITARGTAFFQDQDDMIFLPLKIGQQQLLGIHYLQMINVKVDSAQNIDQTIKDIKQVMNAQHHIRTPAEVDYTVRNLGDMISMLSTITKALSLFLIAMAAISLVVGGIGILNIMLTTVAERTREIGLRKAVGATENSIRRQFVLEAGIMTAFGGLIGIIVGVIVSYLIALLIKKLGYNWAFVISFNSVVLAIGVSVLIGIIFGLYPAIKASRLDPIEALHYE